MKPFLLANAKDSAWVSIDELGGTKSYVIDVDSGRWAQGRELFALKVTSEGQEAIIRLKLKKVGKGFAKLDIVADRKDGSKVTRTIVTTMKRKRKRKFKDDQFIRVFEMTRSHAETAHRIGITPEYVSRTAKRIEKKIGRKLKHHSEKTEIIRLFGRPLVLKKFTRTWNSCDNIDEVIDALSFTDIDRTQKQLKSRLSILAHRIRKSGDVELKKFKRGRQAKREEAVSE